VSAMKVRSLVVLSNHSALGLPDVFCKNTVRFVHFERSRLHVIIRTYVMAQDPLVILCTYFYSFTSEFLCFTFSQIFRLPTKQ